MSHSPRRLPDELWLKIVDGALEDKFNDALRALTTDIQGIEHQHIMMTELRALVLDLGLTNRMIQSEVLNFVQKKRCAVLLELQATYPKLLPSKLATKTLLDVIHECNSHFMPLQLVNQLGDCKMKILRVQTQCDMRLLQQRNGRLQSQHQSALIEIAALREENNRLRREPD